MDNYMVLLLFILGVILGSFFNVVGIRMPQKIPYLNDRSSCLTCKVQLKWIDLIPIISYLLLRGKCRQCHTRIRILYPIVEFFTGFLFAYSYVKVGINWELLLLILLISMCMILFVTDICYMIIPDKVLLFFLPLFIMIQALSPIDSWYEGLIGSALSFIILASIIVISKGGMGAGDMKLFVLLGFILGWKLILLTFFLASCLGLLGAGTMMICKKLTRNQAFPFGPYIIIGALISYYYGSEIIAWYISLFMRIT